MATELEHIADTDVLFNSVKSLEFAMSYISGTLLRSEENSVANELELNHLEAALDEALMESFPASDPIAVNFSSVVTYALTERGEAGEATNRDGAGNKK